MKHGANSRGSKAPASQSLRDGLEGAGVTDAMMGVADAGYANTVGAALEDVGLLGTCFLEYKWDVDGDRTFVLKVLSWFQTVLKINNFIHISLMFISSLFG